MVGQRSKDIKRSSEARESSKSLRMMLVTKLTFFCCLAMLGWVWADEEFTLEIPQGSLKGLKKTTINQGKTMYSFKGIPYAKPNVGPNKFRESEPEGSWSGVLDATQHRSTCVFHCMIRQDIFGDEDCLYLNVYTPEPSIDGKKAVMVWFHSGGFNGGSGDDDIFGPDFLIEKDVVVVTLNYRLGAIGFLNTGDANAPGNVGLKDQVLALKWVRDNIKNFGGCPKKVTIFGHDAGAASVQYHMLSPMSEGLFNNAISQSGSMLNPSAYNNKPKESAFMLGEMLGVKTTDSAELVNKLKEFSAKELVDASIAMAKTGNHMNGFMSYFVPSSEANVGQEIFLAADPWELLKSGKMADVPFMSGITADEGSLFTNGMIMQNPDMVDDNLDMFTPNDLNITDEGMRKEIGQAIKQFYFDGKSVAMNQQKATDLISDVFFNYGSAISTELINSRNDAPVYKYFFAYYSPAGFMKALFGMEDGVAHGDDMWYEFYGNAFKNKPAPGTPAEKMTNIVTELWTNFAKESNPTPNMDGEVKVTWEPKGKEDNYLEITMEPMLKQGMIKDRINFWANIYKNVLGDHAKLFS